MFTRQRGISLIELIMFIIIISVALVGILLVMNQVTKHSADPLIRKQAMAIAESLLEEVELHSASGVGTGTSRSDWTTVENYNNYTGAISGVPGYNVGVSAQATTWLSMPTDEIIVTVTHLSSGESMQAVGYRVNYE